MAASTRLLMVGPDQTRSSRDGAVSGSSASLKFYHHLQSASRRKRIATTTGGVVSLCTLITAGSKQSSRRISFTPYVYWPPDVSNGVV